MRTKFVLIRDTAGSDKGYHHLLHLQLPFRYFLAKVAKKDYVVACPNLSNLYSVRIAIFGSYFTAFSPLSFPHSHSPLLTPLYPTQPHPTPPSPLDSNLQTRGHADTWAGITQETREISANLQMTI
jgi:hypothetical protein